MEWKRIESVFLDLCTLGNWLLLAMDNDEIYENPLFWGQGKGERFFLEGINFVPEDNGNLFL